MVHGTLNLLFLMSNFAHPIKINNDRSRRKSLSECGLIEKVKPSEWEPKHIWTYRICSYRRPFMIRIEDSDPSKEPKEQEKTKNQENSLQSSL